MLVELSIVCRQIAIDDQKGPLVRPASLHSHDTGVKTLRHRDRHHLDRPVRHENNPTTGFAFTVEGQRACMGEDASPSHEKPVSSSGCPPR